MEERLRKFAALVDAGSFTKAAAELRVSQPALSAAMAKLERELKAPLLVRGIRPLALTPAGKLAYQSAQGLSMQLGNLRLRLAELANEAVALRIGMIDGIADTLFAADAGLAVLGQAKVSVAVNNSRYLTEAVERGELDFAYVAGSPKSTHLLEAAPVAVEPLVVVKGVAYRVPAGDMLPDFISYDEASNTARLVRLALKAYGMALEVAFYSTSPEVILRLVLRNKGVAALPYLMVETHLASGQMTRLGGTTPWLIPRPISVIRRRDRELPMAFKRLTDQLAGTLDGLASSARQESDKVL